MPQRYSSFGCFTDLLSWVSHTHFWPNRIPVKHTDPATLLFLRFTFVTGRIIIYHYNEVIMGTMTSQITSLTIVYSTVCSGADQRKHQSSASLAFVRGIHRGTGEFPAQIGSNAESVSIWWRYHAIRCFATVICGWPIPGGSLCLHWLYLVCVLLLDTSSLWKGAPKPTSIFSLVS